ncbi:DOMON-like domain-containing protein [Sphingomonas sp.]|uniref:DOMON-like domain-containing protein n=1 Tax=Sphingomonas sp. TaxID=28214 RepID=UPI003B3AFEB2
MLSLNLHPSSPSPATRIEVELARVPGGLRLDYHLFGDLNRVRFPGFRPAVRTDELWKHSCLEAFVGAGDGYYEFNLSPSTQWAAYHFDAYRAGMREADIPDPAVAWAEGRGRATLSATLSLPPDVTGPIGLSAVIEDTSGVRSFWALAHPPGPPDFHNAACFAAELPPAG